MSETINVKINAANSVGLAIFVKTPGHSPLKTRLAQRLGVADAEMFHILSAAAIGAVAQATPSLTAYWAVAEASAIDDAHWQSLPCILQGAGDLGARMRQVCEQLRALHGCGILIGADAPQITAEDLQHACMALSNYDCVIGLSEDGGFWLFGTRVALPDAAWIETPWSQPDTAARFIDALGDLHVARLRTLRDVDAIEDLPPLQNALQELPAPLTAQRALYSWLRGLSKDD